MSTLTPHKEEIALGNNNYQSSNFRIIEEGIRQSDLRSDKRYRAVASSKEHNYQRESKFENYSFLDYFINRLLVLSSVQENFLDNEAEKALLSFVIRLIDEEEGLVWPLIFPDYQDGFIYYWMSDFDTLIIRVNSETKVITVETINRFNNANYSDEARKDRELIPKLGTNPLAICLPFLERISERVIALNPLWKQTMTEGASLE